MKKIIAFTIGAVAVLGLSACSKTETNNTSVTINDTASNETLADNVTETSNTGNTAGDSSK
ncbi:hypothetical protein [Sphingomonas sp. MMS24-J13]|uniref:hypothetical protein n=1 Tax=Sphingomonas sp. MMS24-J13 TaxID=3238686 RepID=UPI00384E567F